MTWSVYIGSSIYSAGTQTVVEDFGVSQVKATLGLTWVEPCAIFLGLVLKTVGTTGSLLPVMGLDR